MENIKVGEIRVSVERKDIKNIHLSVNPPEGKVKLSVPKTTKEDTIRLFLISKIPWIKKQQKKFNNQVRQSPREYISGESHYFFGKRYRLNVYETNKKQRVEIKNNSYIDLYVRPNSTVEKREDVMKEWYREELKKVIPEYINKWEKTMDIQLNFWGVKQMKTKWGSCNADRKRIWVNLELAKKNPRCLEYVIVHEMVHLKERKHSDRFKKLMDKYLPNWRAVKRELNEIVYESVE
jgi:hypothetical protein